MTFKQFKEELRKCYDNQYIGDLVNLGWDKGYITDVKGPFINEYILKDNSVLECEGHYWFICLNEEA